MDRWLAEKGLEDRICVEGVPKGRDVQQANKDSTLCLPADDWCPMNVETVAISIAWKSDAMFKKEYLAQLSYNTGNLIASNEDYAENFIGRHPPLPPK
eukprot:scaffold6655_cov169-Amphora_coffeaeformis.AAC.27